jgi:hypothetical protein
MRAIFLTCFFLLTGCSGDAERREVDVESGYVGQEHSLKIPAVFIENLPHSKDVSTYIAMNTATLLAKEATLRIEHIINSCTNCLDPDRLVRPLRVVNIAVGEKFRVIGEYLYYRNRFPLANSQIHFLLLEGRDGKLTEISKLAFEEFFIPHEQGYSVPDQVKWILGVVNSFETKNAVSFAYCPYLNTFDNQNISKFINDFALGDEINVSSNQDLCKGGSKLIFYSPESYLTAQYYFSEWRLNGRWLQYHQVVK